MVHQKVVYKSLTNLSIEDLRTEIAQREEAEAEKAREAYKFAEAERAEQAAAASRLIATYVAQAYAAIAEAQKLADETGVTFSFSVNYGMGGTYYPAKKTDEDDGDWSSSSEGWISSSESC